MNVSQAVEENCKWFMLLFTGCCRDPNLAVMRAKRVCLQWTYLVRTLHACWFLINNYVREEVKDMIRGRGSRKYLCVCFDFCNGGISQGRGSSQMGPGCIYIQQKSWYTSHALGVKTGSCWSWGENPKWDFLYFHSTVVCIFIVNVPVTNRVLEYFQSSTLL